jgi:hypothetical protein
VGKEFYNSHGYYQSGCRSTLIGNSHGKHL